MQIHFVEIIRNNVRIIQQAWVMNKLKLSSRESSPFSKNRILAQPTNDLQLVMTQSQEENVCFLRDSPFRILRVSTDQLFSN